MEHESLEHNFHICHDATALQDYHC